MRAPDRPDKAMSDKLVDSIVESFKPADQLTRRQWEREKQAAVEAVVREQINFLSKIAPVSLTTAARRETRNNADDLSKMAKKLENQLKRIERDSPELHMWLGLGSNIGVAQSDDGVTTMLVSTRLSNFGADLAWLREACGEAVRSNKGKQDELKRMCAKTACFLISAYSEHMPPKTKVTKRKATIHHATVVAGLLCQAVTGRKPKTDFRWLCRQILNRLPNATEAEIEAFWQKPGA